MWRGHPGRQANWPGRPGEPRDARWPPAVATRSATSDAKQIDENTLKMGLLCVIMYGAILFGVTFIAAFLFLTRKFGHWRKKGVKHLKPVPVVGNLEDVVLQRKNIGIVSKDIYLQHKKEPFIGLYAFDEPVLQIHDLNLVKAILVKDFQNFCDRSLHVEEELDPLPAKGLLLLEGERWKHSRAALSPSFTPAKMKQMHDIVVDCGKLLASSLEKNVQENVPVAVNDVVTRYTTDVVASCVLGIHRQALENPKAEFREIVRLLFDFSTWEIIKLACAFLAPKIIKMLRLSLMKPEINRFVRQMVSSKINEMQMQKNKRNDLLESLIQLTTKENVEKDNNQTSKNFLLDEEDVAGHALILIATGVETPATTVSNALYELALHSDVQEKLRQELQNASASGSFSYESLHGVKYLDMILNETLRKYPPLPFIDRISKENYTLPCTELTLEKGSRIMIPLYGFHMNPEFYPNPDNFDPERFSEQNKKNIPNFAYLPFGEGPRSCVAMSFGKMIMKVALAQILSKYSVHPCSSTPKKITFDTKAFLLKPTNDIHLIFKSH